MSRTKSDLNFYKTGLLELTAVYLSLLGENFFDCDTFEEDCT